jgi:excisionase family DNA binding protein
MVRVKLADGGALFRPADGQGAVLSRARMSAPSQCTFDRPVVNWALEAERGDAPRLALRPKEAAKALGIGTRLLWSKTNRGEIPHIKVGKCVVYPIDALRDWLAERAAKGVRP